MDRMKMTAVFNIQLILSWKFSIMFIVAVTSSAVKSAGVARRFWLNV